MRATLMYCAGDVRVEDVPDPRLEAPTDSLVRITTSCICGDRAVDLDGHRATADREALTVPVTP